MAIPFPFVAPLERASAGRYNDARGGPSPEGPKLTRCVTLCRQARGSRAFLFASTFVDTLYLYMGCSRKKVGASRNGDAPLTAKAPSRLLLD